MFNLIDEKLNYEEQLFRVLAEQSSDIIVFLNREGVITYANPAVERTLGFKVEERIGASGFECIHPDNLKSVTDAFNTLIRDINAPAQQLEIRLCHRDGSWHMFESVANNLLHNNVVKGITPVQIKITGIYSVPARKK